MDKDTLRAIEIIRDILADIIWDSKLLLPRIATNQDKLDKIINDNKEY